MARPHVVYHSVVIFCSLLIAVCLATEGGAGIILHAPTAAEDAAGEPLRLQLTIDCTGQDCGRVYAQAVRIPAVHAAAAEPFGSMMPAPSDEQPLSGPVSKAALAVGSAMAAGVI